VDDGSATDYQSEPSSTGYGGSLQFTNSIHKLKCAQGCPCVDKNNPCFDPNDCTCRPVKCRIIREYWHGFTRNYYSNLSPDYTTALSAAVSYGATLTGSYEGGYRRRLQEEYDQDQPYDDAQTTYGDSSNSYEGGRFPKSRTVCSCQVGKHYCDPGLARGKAARNWQWWTAAIFALLTIAYAFQAFRNPEDYRWYLYILLAACFICMVSFASMASHPVGHISTPKPDYAYSSSAQGGVYTASEATGYRRRLTGAGGAGVMFTSEGAGGSVDRQTFWIQYVQWFLVTPLLIFVTGKFGNFSSGDLYSAIAFMWLTLGLGFLATATNGPARFGYFLFGFLTFFPVLKLFLGGKPVTDKEKSTYTTIKLLTVILWFLYPIVWILGTGVGVLGVDRECICYCVLALGSVGLVGGYVFLYGSSLPSLQTGSIPLPFGDLNSGGPSSGGNPLDLVGSSNT